MSEILLPTSSAVNKLISPSSSSGGGSVCSVRLKASRIREVSRDEVMSRSRDVETLVNSFSGRDMNEVGEAEVREVTGIPHDANSSVSIIDVGKVDSSSSIELKTDRTGASILSFLAHEQAMLEAVSREEGLKDVDLIPCRDSDTLQSDSTIRTLNSDTIRHASTPNNLPENQQQNNKETDGVTDKAESDWWSGRNNALVGALPTKLVGDKDPQTDKQSEPPPALVTKKNQKGFLQQGVEVADSKKLSLQQGQHLPKHKQPSDDGELVIDKLNSDNNMHSARSRLKNVCNPATVNPIKVEQYKRPSEGGGGEVGPSSKQQPPWLHDLDTIIKAAVSAAVPYHSLQGVITKLSHQLEQQQQQRYHGDHVTHDHVQTRDPAEDLTDPSLDVTLLPTATQTPIHPRTVPHPRTAPRPQNSSKLIGGDGKRMTVPELRQKFVKRRDEHNDDLSSSEATADNSDRKNVNLVDEESLAMRRSMQAILKEAQELQREIKEIKVRESRESVRRDLTLETPADVYLRQIAERERTIPSKFVPNASYRLPSYLQEGRNLLHEVEEKRRSFEEKKYPLDATFLCDSHETEEKAEIKKRVEKMLMKLESEIQEERRNPITSTKTAKSGQDSPPQNRKKVPFIKTKKQEYERNKALYAQIKAKNEQNIIQANIAKLKAKQKQLVENMHDAKPSPYRRPGKPQSYPLVPRDSFNELVASTPTSKAPVGHKTPEHRRSMISKDQVEKTTRESESEGSSEGDMKYEDHSMQISPLAMLSKGVQNTVSTDTSESDSTLSRDSDITRDAKHADFIQTSDIPSAHVIQLKGQKIPEMYQRFRKPESPVYHTSPCTPPTDVQQLLLSVEDEVIEQILSGKAQPSKKPPSEPSTHHDVNLGQLFGPEFVRSVQGLGISAEEADRLIVEVVEEEIAAMAAMGEEEDELVGSVGKEEEVVVDSGSVLLDEQKPRSTKSKSIISKHSPVCYSYSAESFASSSGSSELGSGPKTPTLTSRSEQSPGYSTLERVPTPSLTPPSKQTSPGGALSDVESLVQTPLEFDDTIDQVRLGYGNIVTPDMTPYHHILSHLKTSQDDTLLSQHPLTPLTTERDAATLPRDPDHMVLSPTLSGPQRQTLDLPDHQQLPEPQPSESEPTYSSPTSTESRQSLDSQITTEPTTSTDNVISRGEILNPIPRQYREIGQLIPSAHDVSEGEWVFSPTSKISARDFVKDPEVRELLDEQINNTVDFLSTLRPPYRLIEPDTDPYDDNENLFEVFEPEKSKHPPPSYKKPTVIRVMPSDAAGETPRTSHPKPPVYRALPNPPAVTGSGDVAATNHSPAATQETLEMITPIPHSDSQVTESVDAVEESPSPPPFGGLDLEDYISEGEVTFDSDNDSI